MFIFWLSYLITTVTSGITANNDSVRKHQTSRAPGIFCHHFVFPCHWDFALLVVYNTNSWNSILCSMVLPWKHRSLGINLRLWRINLVQRFNNETFRKINEKCSAILVCKNPSYLIDKNKHLMISLYQLKVS